MTEHKNTNNNNDASNDILALLNDTPEPTMKIVMENTEDILEIINSQKNSPVKIKNA